MVCRSETGDDGGHLPLRNGCYGTGEVGTDTGAGNRDCLDRHPTHGQIGTEALGAVLFDIALFDVDFRDFVPAGIFVVLFDEFHPVVLGRKAAAIGFDPDTETALRPVEPFQEFADPGASLCVGLSQLGDQMLIRFRPVIVEHPRHRRGGAVAFGALIDHWDDHIDGAVGVAPTQTAEFARGILGFEILAEVVAAAPGILKNQKDVFRGIARGNAPAQGDVHTGRLPAACVEPPLRHGDFPAVGNASPAELPRRFPEQAVDQRLEVAPGHHSRIAPVVNGNLNGVQLPLAILANHFLQRHGKERQVFLAADPIETEAVFPVVLPAEKTGILLLDRGPGNIPEHAALSRQGIQFRTRQKFCKKQQRRGDRPEPEPRIHRGPAPV